MIGAVKEGDPTKQEADLAKLIVPKSLAKRRDEMILDSFFLSGAIRSFGPDGRSRVVGHNDVQFSFKHHEVEHYDGTPLTEEEHEAYQAEQRKKKEEQKRLDSLNFWERLLYVCANREEIFNSDYIRTIIIISS